MASFNEQNQESSEKHSFDMSQVDEPSICVPWARADACQDWKVIASVFDKSLGYKCVKRVDRVFKTSDTGQKYCTLFIHLKWPKNKTAKAVKKMLERGDEVKVIYSKPFFWKCRKSNIPRPGQKKEEPTICPDQLAEFDLSDTDDDTDNEDTH